MIFHTSRIQETTSHLIYVDLFLQRNWLLFLHILKRDNRPRNGKALVLSQLIQIKAKTFTGTIQ